MNQMYIVFIFVAMGVSALLFIVAVKALLKKNKTLFNIASNVFTLACCIIAIALISDPFYARFDSSNTRFRGEIPHYVCTTNEALLDGLRYVDTREIKDQTHIVRRYWFSRQAFYGMYDPASRIIYIPASTMNENTWWHELAHHLWYNALSEDHKTSYEAIHAKSIERMQNQTSGEISEELKMQLLLEEGFPTEYASRNVDEDWAESFSFWATQTNKQWQHGRGEERHQKIDSIMRNITGCEQSCIRTTNNNCINI